MGKVVTVMNMKGGVGKTTVAIHVGGALGKYKWKAETKGRKVLLIDYGACQIFCVRGSEGFFIFTGVLG